MYGGRPSLVNHRISMEEGTKLVCRKTLFSWVIKRGDVMDLALMHINDLPIPIH